MELWIRTQHREYLMPIKEELYIKGGNYHGTSLIQYKDLALGTYATYERAMEVLDEIQSKIKNQFIVQANTLLKPDDLKTLKSLYDSTNVIDSIVSDQIVTVTPINADIIIYEMPKE